MMELSGGLTDEYLNIEDILAGQERVLCTFELDVIGLGYLDPSSDEQDVREGTKLELPCWLAAALSGRRRHIVSADLPRPYSHAYRSIFQADATVVDLQRLGPYFYALGTQLLPLKPADAPTLADTLLSVFQGRFRRLASLCWGSGGRGAEEGVHLLDNLERGLLGVGRAAVTAQAVWGGAHPPPTKRPRLAH